MNGKIQERDNLFVVLVIQEILQKLYCMFNFMISYDPLYNMSNISHCNRVIAVTKTFKIVFFNSTFLIHK